MATTNLRVGTTVFDNDFRHPALLANEAATLILPGTATPLGATHRATGLAQGPDGSLYITDDKGGRIWRVIYRGQ